MTERPILFSAPMVKALLDGHKTQTRRLVKSPHVAFIGGQGQQDDPACYGYWVDDDWGRWVVLARDLDEPHQHGRVSLPCPYGQPGDLLWVRETWAASRRNDHQSPSDLPPAVQDPETRTMVPRPLWYRATDDTPPDASAPDWRRRGKERPSIHMCRWMARITLRVEAVRVERLQAISESDARAEGVKPRGDGTAAHHAAFRLLWGEINGHASWDANPWVWCVSFSRVPPC